MSGSGPGPGRDWTRSIEDFQLNSLVMLPTLFLCCLESLRFQNAEVTLAMCIFHALNSRFANVDTPKLAYSFPPFYTHTVSDTYPTTISQPPTPVPTA